MEETNTPAPLGYYLVVANAFGEYARGATIKEPAQIEAILQSENAHYCRKVFG
jgi:hypothetical protein